MRVLATTWNAGQILHKKHTPDFDTWLEPVDEGVAAKTTAPDIYAIAIQEAIPLQFSLAGNTSRKLKRYEAIIRHSIEKHASKIREDEKERPTYSLIKKAHVGGIALLLFGSEYVKEQVDDIQVAKVGCGPLFMSNKGAVGIRFRLLDSHTSWTFVSAHLAAHDHNIERRNADWESIVSQMIFRRLGKLQQIYDTSFLFVMGDLNYRINMKSPDKLTLQSLDNRLEHNLPLLFMHDQLRHEKREKRTMHGLKEGTVNFKPTYKYIVGTDEYKDFTHRIPGWCDRILFLSFNNRIETLYYTSVPEIRLSDHKPVKGLYLIPDNSIQEKDVKIHLPIHPPYAIDGFYQVKRYIGMSTDKIVGSVWGFVYLLGGENDKVGLAFMLLGLLIAVVGKRYGLSFWHAGQPMKLE